MGETQQLLLLVFFLCFDMKIQKLLKNFEREKFNCASVQLLHRIHTCGVKLAQISVSDYSKKCYWI